MALFPRLRRAQVDLEQRPRIEARKRRGVSLVTSARSDIRGCIVSSVPRFGLICASQIDLTSCERHLCYISPCYEMDCMFKDGMGHFFISRSCQFASLFAFTSEPVFRVYGLNLLHNESLLMSIQSKDNGLRISTFRRIQRRSCCIPDTSIRLTASQMVQSDCCRLIIPCLLQ